MKISTNNYHEYDTDILFIIYKKSIDTNNEQLRLAFPQKDWIIGPIV